MTSLRAIGTSTPMSQSQRMPETEAFCQLIVERNMWSSSEVSGLLLALFVISGMVVVWWSAREPS